MLSVLGYSDAGFAFVSAACGFVENQKKPLTDLILGDTMT
jgi:hypothetical protein